MAKDTKKTTKQSRAIDRKIDVLSERLRKIRKNSNEDAQHLVCPMAKLIYKLEEQDHETGQCLYDALNDELTSTSDIIREMRASGHRISRQTIYDYRKRVCACAHDDKCGLDEKFGGE